MPVGDLIALVRGYNPKSDAARITHAYEYGLKMHEGQLRASGEPYFMHPVAVAAILTEQRLDDDTIITALLHDTVEDTATDHEALVAQFGSDVAQLVQGVTKLTKLELHGGKSEQAENFRKLFIAMSRDMRVLLVKLADRLHNMRTIAHMPAEKQAKKARETMEIYAPLAGRMGMQWMREELEDLAFKVLNRDARKSIIKHFITLQEQSGDILGRIGADIRHELAVAGMVAEVDSRAKKPYSMWRKMGAKELTFSRLSDIYGFRIICDSVADCYRILGIIHHRWRAVPGRFKDYISLSKPNGYRSLHTTVAGHDGKKVEVQIRTLEMHEVAETGVAAHWAYREGGRRKNPFAIDAGEWIRELTEGDEEDFLSHVKLEMYSDLVFCFTPKGDVIELPRGATPLDFAYAVHTRVGDKTVSASVNGLRVPLSTKLRNGQTVKILTAEGQKPNVGWLDMVKTKNAIKEIRRSVRMEERKSFIQLGRELARVAFERIDKKITDQALRTAARKMGYGGIDDLLARVGAAEVGLSQVLRALYPDVAQPASMGPQGAARAHVSAFQGHAFTRASCCQPLPGERIVGIAASGRGLVAHAIDCQSLADLEQGSEWIDLAWPSDHGRDFHIVSLHLTISNSPGALGRICTLVGEQGANISDLRFTDRNHDFYHLVLDSELCDITHLHRMLTAIEAESHVAQVARAKDFVRNRL